MVYREQTRIEGGRRVMGVSPELPPLVSVIIAVYNGAATLERALRSVITQTFSRFELIIVDGGSSDCSIDIIRNHENSIDYWISEPDKGIYDALNKGINLARGEWLYILGADDLLYGESVLHAVFSKPYQSKMIYGNVLYGDTGTIYDGKFSKQKLLSRNICQQAVFYHRDLFVEFGKFELCYPFVSDWVFNMRLFASPSVNPRHVNITIAYYSTHGSSSTRDDHCFNRERLRLVRRIFGIKYYVAARYELAKTQLAAVRKKYFTA